MEGGAVWQKSETISNSQGKDPTLSEETVRERTQAPFKETAREKTQALLRDVAKVRASIRLEESSGREVDGEVHVRRYAVARKSKGETLVGETTAEKGQEESREMENEAEKKEQRKTQRKRRRKGRSRVWSFWWWCKTVNKHHTEEGKVLFRSVRGHV